MENDFLNNGSEFSLISAYSPYWVMDELKDFVDEVEKVYKELKKNLQLNCK